MKQKKLHPIIYFSMLFVVLIAIQSYFLYNTVLLKKNEIRNKARDILEQSKTNYSFLEDTRWDENLYLWQDLKNKEVAEKHFITKMKLISDSIAPSLHNYVIKQYKETGVQLAFKKELLGVYDKKNNEKIITKPIVIYATNPKPVVNYLLSESKWESTYTSSNVETQRDTINTKKLDDKIVIAHTLEKSVSTIQEHSYIIQQAIYYDVLNMNFIIFKELWLLFLVSILLLGMVLFLYFKSYQKYKEQEAQVLLLHDTIDNVAHEFKTPLATLKIASKQLRLSKDVATLNILDRQISRLENLLKPLDETDFIDKYPNQQYVVQFLNDIKSIHMQIIFNENVSIESELSLNVYEFESIIGNLIDNSIKYGSTCLDIVINQKENNTLIKVKDDGFGISKEEQLKIFDKYYRVATQNIHNVKGLGVGLYIVHKIVEKNKGKITINSDLGKGCELIIAL